MKTNRIDMTRNTGTAVRTMAPAIICGLLLAASSAQAGANDCPMRVKCTNAKAVPRDAGTALVSFNLSWDISWRHEVNHDAVWVFFKARSAGASEWQPVRLVADKVRNPTGFGQGSGTPLEFLVPQDEGGPVGMFVRRGEYGYGLASASNVTAVMEWKPSTDTRHPTPDTPEVRAYAVEMVYIPEGAFYLNTGGVEPFRFYQYTDGTQHTQPYRVASEGAIPTGQQADKLWARRGAQPEDKGEIPAAYPKGYGAFYCMKIQIKGRQYTDFLNTIPPEQAEKRYASEKEGNSGITRSGTNPVVYAISNEGGMRLFSPVSWGDGIAYAAWAGLRPMSELEYIKIGRGMLEPTTQNGDTQDFPSGWGVMDWTGWRTAPERTVTVANPQGRNFKGTHGRGTLAVPADWPQEDAVGSGIRGGYGPINGHPSTRTEAARVAPERIQYLGWRGVRTAPKEAAE